MTAAVKYHIGTLCSSVQIQCTPNDDEVIIKERAKRKLKRMFGHYAKEFKELNIITPN